MKLNNKESIEKLDVNERVDLTERNDLPEAHYFMLALDISEDVRFGLASNANIPKFLLHRLAEDENVFVAARATKTLDRLKLEENKMKMNIMHHGHVACISQNCHNILQA